MPKVLVVGEFAFLIFTNDHSPAHVHGRKAGMLAKISLEPEVVLLRYDKDLTAADLCKMVNTVKDNRNFLLEQSYAIHPKADLEEL